MNGLRRTYINNVTMNMGLAELFSLVGPDHGISFYYEELPGVLVTIGFTIEEEDAEEDDLQDEHEPTGGKNDLH